MAKEESFSDKFNNFVEKTKENLIETKEQVVEYTSISRQKRAEYAYYLQLNYAPMDLIIPSKMGATLGSQKDIDNSYEIEILRGTLAFPFIVEDLGKMTDFKYSLLFRSYSGRESFNFSYGVTYFDFTVELGDKLLNKLTGGFIPAVDLIKIQSLGFHLGVGNRWNFGKNFSFGVDWITWSQPLFVTKREAPYLDYVTDEDAKKSVNDAISLISYLPRFSLFKLQLAYMFN